MITSRTRRRVGWLRDRIVVLFDGRQLGVQRFERPFQCGQGCGGLVKLARFAELLQLERGIDRGARAEIRY